MVEYLDSLFFSLSTIEQISIASAINLFVAIISYVKKKLTISGSIGAFFMGLVIYYSMGLAGYLLMMLFFISSGIISKIAKKHFNHLKIHEKGSTRDIMQVIANGLFAMLYAILYIYKSDITFAVLFAVAIAESTADTYSGDLGVLSKSDPISIITFKKIPKGISGGVSLFGTICGLIGAFFIAIVFITLFAKSLDKKISYLIIIVTAAFIGNVVDSLLGATIQPLFYDEKTDMFTELPILEGRKTEKIRGARFFDNDMVNLSSNLSAILFASSLLYFI